MPIKKIKKTFTKRDNGKMSHANKVLISIIIIVFGYLIVYKYYFAKPVIYHGPKTQLGKNKKTYNESNSPLPSPLKWFDSFSF